MIKAFLKKTFGTRNERALKTYNKICAKINLLEPTIKQLTNDELKAKTSFFRSELKSGKALSDLLPEAFAITREAAMRTLGQRHFDVQLLGGMVLNDGKIAEMRTGEGKTLVATLSAYLNALVGKVHIVTVNDYLAKRDAAWMSPIYDLLGLSVGVIFSGQSQDEKKANYAKDITYGTNNEFGFDYLRDNMVEKIDDKVQQGLDYAIIDEVDSILIDEARTPLIISGSAEESTDLYQRINSLIPKLTKQVEESGTGDYKIDEKFKQAYLTEEGHQNIEKILVAANILDQGESLYDSANIKLMHYLIASLRAHTLFHRDVDYIVKNNEVVIIDEHTGRAMEGRRWSDGLHQAVEAKEGVAIRNENQTLASITFQNYFRLYKKLAGMTGTADTEAYEFQQIYGLEVLVIPTNRPMIREDYPDKIFLTQTEKHRSIIEDIKSCRAKGQPVLVGTGSIENSEVISNLLSKEKIPHQVLNAKQHEREAKIIAEAGRPGTVTIATNMAGRGTDIVLGGNLNAELLETQSDDPKIVEHIKSEWQKRHDEVIKSGGLYVIGAERHESRRIDNQLRGRSGRQGDPGASRFYLSLEDNLMRIFASPRVTMIMKRLGMQENEAIEHAMITQAVEKAQRKVEGHNFDIRKQLLEYDNVINEQRKIIYSERDGIMGRANVSEMVGSILHDAISNLVPNFIPENSLEEEWKIKELSDTLEQEFHLHLPIQKWLEEDESLHASSLCEKILHKAKNSYQEKVKDIDVVSLEQIEKSIVLYHLDSLWKDHLAAIDYLREGIHLRGYAQEDPKQAYKREAFKMFTTMLENLKHAVAKTLYLLEISNNPHEESAELSSVISRNSLCPCGSKKKYKKCCGKLA